MDAYSALVTDAPQLPFQVYRIVVTFAYHTGQFQLPVSAPAVNSSTQQRANCEVVSLYAPRTIKVVDWVAGRWGDKPVPPAPLPADSNETFLWGRLTGMRSMRADSTEIWMTSGKYAFAMTSPKFVGDNLFLGMAVVYAFDPTDVTLYVEDFDYTGLVDSGTSSGKQYDLDAIMDLI